MEIGANQKKTEKTAIQNVLPVRFFVSVISVSSWTQENVTEITISFLGEKNSENVVFVGPSFVALGGENLDQYFNSNMLDFDFNFI